MKKTNLMLAGVAVCSLALLSCGNASVELARKLQSSYEYEGKTVVVGDKRIL